MSSILNRRNKARKKAFLAFQEPIKSEIFNQARLEAHAESLALAQKVTSNPRQARDIAKRIKDNSRVLEESYSLLLEATTDNQAVTPAAEWLLDNFHIVRAQLKDIHEHLPPRFYRELPKLSDGPLKGLPRVYGIAWAFVAHTDSRFDPELLKHFLMAYQKVQPLTIGELWAVSISLRAVLMENLRRLAARIVGSQLARKDADGLSDEILGLTETKARPLKQILSEVDSTHFSRSFAVELLQRLRFQDPSVEPVLEWLDARLKQESLIADEVVASEHNSQTAANATVRNIITSCRLMSVFDWRIFFEEVSLVDEVLRANTGYRQMDFTSRNRYRHGLEELSRYSPLTELEVARLVVSKVGATHASPLQERETDVGYYLISSGRIPLEKEIGFKPRWRKQVGRWIGTYSDLIFIGSILALSLGLIGVIALMGGHASLWIYLLAFFPASEISGGIIHRIIAGLTGPKYLPRLNLEAGIPAQFKTFIVIPTFLTERAEVEQQFEQLETHYLANPDSNLRFALLTDGADSSVEINDHDEELLQSAFEKVSCLNEKYGSASSDEDLFYIFHRKRLFNKQEGKWMGWERKRGKLEEFNRLLLGACDTNHVSLGSQPIKVPAGIRYVITLDADTKLPRGVAAELIGTLAHPLNQAYIDPEKRRVTHGYGILQPRITPALPSIQDSTIYQRVSAGPSGVDPYASAISDVYQDLFDEGSYTGKGIYDVAIFEAVLKDRIPENALLSHDLFEGNFARCAFVSDIEFFEDFPSHSGVAAKRSHRWMRGDWQLLPWIFGLRGKNISLIGRWKMLDNLRRSLVSPMTLLLMACEFILPDNRLIGWFILALSSLFVPAILVFIADIFPARRITPIGSHIQFAARDFLLGAQRFLLNLILLPYYSCICADAVMRTLYRLLITHRHMLEWTTAAQAQSASKLTARSFWMEMRSALILTSLLTAAIALFNISHFPLASLFLLLWAVSPSLAHWFSSPPQQQPSMPLQPEDIWFLTLAARRIWQFFATLVTEEENYLPPDNFQEDPDPVVAHRSSPTNFGLYLLSALAAHDFGWIGTLELADRLSLTLKSLEQLPKHQGHFFNWYETLTARPLEPKYISSVDNGNLAGHLIALGQGCLDKLMEMANPSAKNEGILAITLILQESLAEVLQRGAENKTVLNELSLILEDLVTSIKRLDHWMSLREKVNKLVEASSSLHDRELLVWTRALKNDIASHARDMDALYAWTEFAGEPIANDWSVTQCQMWKQIQKVILEPVSLKDLPSHCEKIISGTLLFDRSFKSDRVRATPAFVDLLLESLEHSLVSSREVIRQLSEAHLQCHRLCKEMNFKMLYDPVRKLFSIGMRVSDNTLDDSYYDLLASEARLTSFIAIAKGDVPVSHWFSLNRTLASVENGAVLVSWSGSMFEYLMPALVMKSPRGSLLEQTCKLVIHRQMAYALSREIPWGISESAYNKRDIHLTYQYSNFGVPDLGLKRGLGADLVVAPYASFLAALFDSGLAAANLRKLKQDGVYGLYGFYEAVDFTTSRLPEGQPLAVIKTYMAHHQGMSLVALANVFKKGVMQRRFHAEPIIQATELLLQERTPRNVGTIKPNEESFQIGMVREAAEYAARVYHTPNRPIPTTLLLSDGNYNVMVNSAGSGFSRFGDRALTRWREDVTCDQSGSYFFLKDLNTGKVWSATYQPTCVEADSYEVKFTEDRALFTREDNGILCQLEIFISPEDSAEIRRISLTNTGNSSREIEITSYLEVVLNTQASDLAHPAFSNLFVQTEFVSELDALFATRRPRSAGDKNLWMALVLLRDMHGVGTIEFETSRENFIGRGRSVHGPKALYENSHLTNSSGAVLDPIFSLRTKMKLGPGMKGCVTYSTLVAPTREELIYSAEKFHEASTFERVTNLAWTQAQVKLHHLNIEPAQAHQFQRLATRLIYSDPSLRPSSDILKSNIKNVTGLWAHGISGDYPIILLRISDIEDCALVRQLLKAHEYFTTKRLEVDLIILNEKANSYAQDLQTTLESMVHSSMGVGHSSLPQSRGKVFSLRADLMAQADVNLLTSQARAIVSSRMGSLAEQVKRVKRLQTHDLPHRDKALVSTLKDKALPLPHLELFNGIGGFSADGREYVIVLQKDDTTPAPWINVIANATFGFQVSESGSGYTWALNSRENQLTPWSNDPVCDPSGETFYILDQETDELWSPTAHPVRVPDSVYIARHSQGYSRFEHLSHGIYSELTQFVAGEDPVKISQLILENKTSKRRKLSIAAYVEWVLGFSRATMAPQTITEFDEESGALFAYNFHGSEYSGDIAFFVVEKFPFSFTGDRTEFIGRNGSLNHPKGLFQKDSLSGSVGAGLDPCAALQTEITLAPHEKIQIGFLLGQAKTRLEARRLIHKINSQKSTDILNQVIAKWDQILGKVQVETPDRALNFMLNRWWLYQTLVCRFWARSAFYQAGGAIGFRDQLQDVMVLTLTLPQLARNHILHAASRQFVEGDVQHWWHLPTGRGVRTHSSDDYLWLPYVVHDYVQATGDAAILSENVSFIEGPILRADQEDSYYTPTQSNLSATLYEHCARALDLSLKTGAHGLPLMGWGDWNDSMNRVGHEGQGESVWLAWFLYSNLMQFVPLAKQWGNDERASRWLEHAKHLQSSLESQAWDGAWYRRAFYDDGTPLGSAENEECKIDSLAQTWAVISQAGDPHRAKQAMASLEKYLIRQQDQLVLLFTPPFDKTPKDPGYIKGYLPGVRENGGQYTHAAAWCVIAYALMGQGKRALELLSLLNPVNHALTPAAVDRYKIEPYVMAGDVYSADSHMGRGGWSWYTGSAGWMYRAAIQFVLGFKVNGNELSIDPCVTEWKHFKICYRHGTSVYTIQIGTSIDPAKKNYVLFDGKEVVDHRHIQLIDDGKTHMIDVFWGTVG